MEFRKKEAEDAGPFETEASPRTPLESGMRLDFLYNREGGVWLVHDKPLPDKLKWVEYDAGAETVTLVMANGRIADPGLRIPPERSFYLTRAMEVTALLMKDGFVTDFSIVPMVSSQMTVN
jgi:hypothetical protein